MKRELNLIRHEIWRDQVSNYLLYINDVSLMFKFLNIVVLIVLISVIAFLNSVSSSQTCHATPCDISGTEIGKSLVFAVEIRHWYSFAGSIDLYISVSFKWYLWHVSTCNDFSSKKPTSISSCREYQNTGHVRSCYCKIIITTQN